MHLFIVDLFAATLYPVPSVSVIQKVVKGVGPSPTWIENVK
jgi:hypothetical protein